MSTDSLFEFQIVVAPSLMSVCSISTADMIVRFRLHDILFNHLHLLCHKIATI